MIRLLRAVPGTLAHAPAALAGAAREFARLALAELGDAGARLGECAAALAALCPAARADLWSAARDAASALDDFARWLAAALPGLPPAVPVGPEHYQWFLREVACVPLAISEIEAVGRREYDRAVWLELVHRNRATHVPEPPLPASAAEQCRAEDTAEAQVRAFYEREDLLSQPGRLGRYLALPMPAYLEPLRFLGVADELTGPGRLTENGVAYVPGPGPGLPYFYAANARDPRAGIIHEGVHYQQLALSWGNPRPLRRHYYDSGANEGIAFYNEELMLAAGPARRRAAHQDRGLQLHAAARPAGDRRRRPGHRRPHHRIRRRRAGGPRTDGHRHRRRGGRVLRRDPRPGADLPDRQNAAHLPARRRRPHPRRPASTCASCTTTSGRTATFRSPCCAGNFWD